MRYTGTIWTLVAGVALSVAACSDDDTAAGTGDSQRAEAGAGGRRSSPPEPEPEPDAAAGSAVGGGGGTSAPDAALSDSTAPHPGDLAPGFVTCVGLEIARCDLSKGEVCCMEAPTTSMKTYRRCVTTPGACVLLVRCDEDADCASGERCVTRTFTPPPGGEQLCLGPAEAGAGDGSAADATR